MIWKPFFPKFWIKTDSCDEIFCTDGNATLFFMSAGGSSRSDSRERRDEEEELQIMAGGAVFHHRHSQRASPSPPTSPNSHFMKGLLASFRVWVTLLDLIRYAVGFPFRLHACA